GLRRNIKNDNPVIGTYGVNKEGSGDMYYKGSNMLHTIRQLVGDDEKWRRILRGLNADFYHQTVTSAQIENYLSDQTGLDLAPIFDQYLRTTMIPVLEYKIKNNKFTYSYTQVVDGFTMPIRIFVDGKAYWLNPSVDWKTEELKVDFTTIQVDKNFYIETLKTD
ncbi:MAG: M1 family peptidase, partial [Maribacter sp.]